MAKARTQKKTALRAVLLTVGLTLLAVVLGGVWALYRAYPYDLREVIEQTAGQYDLDPLFVAAVVRTESHFNAEAQSSAGAVGLMQLMPDTARWIAKKNDWDYSDELLLDERYNIQLGCWYLDYLNDRFDGDSDRLLAAYNAGENNVRRWVEEGRFDGDTPDIPFRETRSFVQKVMNAYEKYHMLYGEPEK